MGFLHSNAAQIETDRLILRRFILDDAQNMLKNWISDPLVQREYGEPVYESLKEVRRLIGLWIKQYDEDCLYRWAIILRDLGECIGQVAFCKNYMPQKTAEAEYCIGQNFWGNGYATEALRAVIEHTFSNTDYNKIEAFVRNENIKSGRVLIKSGMVRTANVKRFELENKLPIGKTCYAIVKDKADACENII